MLKVLTYFIKKLININKLLIINSTVLNYINNLINFYF